MILSTKAGVLMKTSMCAAMLAMPAILAGAAAGAEAPAANIPMAPEVLLPCAGVAISVPASLKPQVPSDASHVFAAAILRDGTPLQTVSLRVYPVAPQDTDKSVMDRIVEGTRKNPNIRDLRELSSMPMPLGDRMGTARLFSYSTQGRTYVTAQVGVIRHLETGNIHLGYILIVETLGSEKKDLLGLLDAAAGSVRFTELGAPADTPILELAEAVVDGRYGYAIRPPGGWFAQYFQDGMILGQYDFLNEGRSPNLQVFTQPVAPLTTAREVVQSIVLRRNEMVKKQHLVVQTLLEGEVPLAGQSGYQVVSQQSAEPPLPSSPGQSSIAILRAICVANTGGQRPRAYGLALAWPGSDATEAKRIMELLAMGFTLTPIGAPGTGATQPAAAGTQPATGEAPSKVTPSAALTAPATAPTTQPATQPATAPNP